MLAFGKMGQAERIKTVALICTLAILALIITFKTFGLSGTLTDSEPWGLYRISYGSLAPGRMVQLRLLTKHIAGIPGDTVRVTAEGSFINGKLWPWSAIPPHTPYRPLPYGSYKLAPGQFWLLGSNPMSWDSRYLGPIPFDMIQSTIEPWWTVSNGYALGSRPWSR